MMRLVLSGVHLGTTHSTHHHFNPICADFISNSPEGARISLAVADGAAVDGSVSFFTRLAQVLIFEWFHASSNQMMRGDAMKRLPATAALLVYMALTHEGSEVGLPVKRPPTFGQRLLSADN